MNQSNKISLILDLDETLIHASKVKLESECDFEVFNYKVYKRPFLSDFINSVGEKFDLAIWSTANEEYALQIVDKIIPEDINLIFVWGRKRAIIKRNFIENSLNLPEFDYIKRLKKVKRLGYPIERILMVDDTPAKCREN